MPMSVRDGIPKRELAVFAASAVGGAVGAVFVWLRRPAPPSCTTLDNGKYACMPIHAVDPPLALWFARGHRGGRDRPQGLMAGRVTWRSSVRLTPALHE